MTKSMMITAAVFVMAVAPAFANDVHSTPSEHSARTHLEQIVTEAKKTQLEAQEISNLLRVKNPDYDRVRTKMDLLSQHVATVNRLVADFDAASPQMTSAQRAEYERMKELSALVNVFVMNKSTLLTGGNADRKILRAKADGIAKRAEMLQASALRIRS